jgi:hypothetical protein
LLLLLLRLLLAIRSLHPSSSNVSRACIQRNGRSETACDSTNGFNTT